MPYRRFVLEIVTEEKDLQTINIRILISCANLHWR